MISVQNLAYTARDNYLSPCLGVRCTTAALNLDHRQMVFLSATIATTYLVLPVASSADRDTNWWREIRFGFASQMADGLEGNQGQLTALLNNHLQIILVFECTLLRPYKSAIPKKGKLVER